MELKKRLSGLKLYRGQDAQVLSKKNDQLKKEQKELNAQLDQMETLLETLKNNHFMAEKLKVSNEVLKIK